MIRHAVVIAILVPAQEVSPATPLEYEIKAAFIYNFAKFVEWERDDGNTQDGILPLCILGEDPFGEIIDKLQGRKVQNLSIHIIRVAGIEDVAGCRILFISKSESGQFSAYLDTLQGTKGILSISDIDGFADSGGVIELALNENRISFLVNIKTARDSGLYLSSKILRLAGVVGDD